MLKWQLDALVAESITRHQTAPLLAASKLDWASQQVAGDLIGRNIAFL